jgi:hypothetical protein
LAGREIKNESVFLELVEPERIVFQHLDLVHNFQMTMIFADEAAKTRLNRIAKVHKIFVEEVSLARSSE